MRIDIAMASWLPQKLGQYSFLKQMMTCVDRNLGDGDESPKPTKCQSLYGHKLGISQRIPPSGVVVEGVLE